MAFSAQRREPENELGRQAQTRARRAMALYRAYYLGHFSDEELAAMADFLESEPGRALQTRTAFIYQTAARDRELVVTPALRAMMSQVCEGGACAAGYVPGQAYLDVGRLQAAGVVVW